jgi:RNA polymerase sigma factor (sigma-70 family)
VLIGMEPESTGLSNAEVRDLYVRYGHLVRRRARGRLSDPQLAQDALQTVFLKIMRHGANVRHADSQLAWLYRACDRVCFDLLRQRYRDLAATVAGSVDAPSVRQPTNARSLLQCLWTKLSRREQQLATLVYCDGLTQSEVSKELGWSRQTINKKIKTIRRAALDLSAAPDFSE